MSKWQDAEARNNFLEDLVLEYSVQLEAASKRISALKEQVKELKEEVDYYKAHCSFPGSIYEAPPILNVPSENTAYFNLQTPQVQVELVNKSDLLAYHIGARTVTNNGKRIVYSYHVNTEALIDPKQRIGVLSYLHKKVLQELEKQLEKSS